jgi:hypothetical protein
MAITFPSPGGQTPANTFSPTSTPFNTTNGLTYVYNPTLGAWISTSASSPVPVAASLAEAAAGVLDTVFLSPKTGVPKDAAGMTGAAILPSGTTAQRPAAPVSGMARVNTDTVPQLEQYAGGAWKPIGVITSNLTLNVATTGNDTTGLGTVAAPWATPQRAMAYLSNYQIAQGVAVTVSVADGTYTFTTPLNLNHPQGSQITINGGTTSGVRPTTSLTGGNAVGNTGATLAANDALLNAYYNTKWQFNGCHGLVCQTNGGVSVNTVLIRGNATSFNGVYAGNSNATNYYTGGGSIFLGTSVAIHNFGGRGLSTSYGGSISASGVTVTNSGNFGIMTDGGGGILAPNCVSSNNASVGVGTNNGGTIYATGLTSRYNNDTGVITNYGGFIFATGATASNNAGSGIATSYGGSIDAQGATASNNGGSGIKAYAGGSIYADNAIANSNAGAGVSVQSGGSIQCWNASASSNLENGMVVAGGGSIFAINSTANDNTQNGFYVNQGGSLICTTSTANNNGIYGVICNAGGTLFAEGVTSTGNLGSSNVRAQGMGYIFFTSGNAAGSLSPAANTVGNGNAFITV